MGFNEFLSSIFGNKSTRDMKEIQPWVEKIKAAYQIGRASCRERV